MNLSWTYRESIVNLSWTYPRCQQLFPVWRIRFTEIMEFGLKWVHMARYELILRLDGALWLTIIFRPLLTPKGAFQTSKKDQRRVLWPMGGSLPKSLIPTKSPCPYFPWWANGPYSPGLGPCCYPPEVGKLVCLHFWSCTVEALHLGLLDSSYMILAVLLPSPCHILYPFPIWPPRRDSSRGGLLAHQGKLVKHQPNLHLSNPWPKYM